MTDRHWLAWEDEMCAGVHCHKEPKDHGTFMISVDAGIEHCPHCGQALRLRWNVYVEEVTDANDGDAA